MLGDRLSENVAYLVPPGKRRCYVTGQLRDDTPEENVRQRWARSLVEEYGYPKKDLGIETSINMGRARKKADLTIFVHAAPHQQDNILIVVEAKRDDLKPSDDKYGDGQLISYMAASPACRFGLWVGKERRAYEKRKTGQTVRVTDIPRFGANQPQPATRDMLVPALELKSVFRRCHNYIYANAGLQKADAFHELLKLIFCKIFDEEESGSDLKFTIRPQERMTTSGQRRLMEERLMPLFRRVMDRYPFIFESDDQIKLDPRIAAYVVSELQFFSFLETGTDVKGDAYEELVGENLRGDRGEYFTPRNVCDMAVQMAMALYKETELTSLRVLDCCCGTGGFLVSWLNNLYGAVLRQEARRPRSSIPAEVRARQRVREVCQRNLFGLDINPHLVRTCQMNLVLHGDGSSNVFRADSVRTPGEWDEDARRGVPYGKVDLLVTNPPFGGDAKIDDAHILSQYELPAWDRRDAMSAMPAEQLFVETALRFLKPGGHLVIVLPDGILNNPGLRYIRLWLLRRAKMIASVDLPKSTFAASGGVNNPSVLIVQRLSATAARNADRGVIDTAYEMFFSAPRTSGLSGTGKKLKPLFLRHADGHEVLDEKERKVIDDEVSAVASRFAEWLEAAQ